MLHAVAFRLANAPSGLRKLLPEGRLARAWRGYRVAANEGQILHRASHTRAQMGTSAAAHLLLIQCHDRRKRVDRLVRS